MDISKTNRIITSLMAFLMLLSSTGFSIDLHLCQGNIKSFSFIGEAKSCHSMKSSCSQKKMTCQAAQANKENVGQCSKGCCSNTTIELPADLDTQKIQSETITIPDFQFIVAFVEVFYKGKIDFRKAIVHYLNYIPPLLDKDIPVLIQSFLL